MATGCSLSLVAASLTTEDGPGGAGPIPACRTVGAPVNCGAEEGRGARTAGNTFHSALLSQALPGCYKPSTEPPHLGVLGAPMWSCFPAVLPRTPCVCHDPKPAFTVQQQQAEDPPPQVHSPSSPSCGPRAPPGALPLPTSPQHARPALREFLAPPQRLWPCQAPATLWCSCHPSSGPGAVPGPTKGNPNRTNMQNLPEAPRDSGLSPGEALVSPAPCRAQPPGTPRPDLIPRSVLPPCLAHPSTKSCRLGH